VLGGMSVFTMIMTVPQVLAIWVGHQAAGVSILSWSAYLVSAVLWLWFGIRRHTLGPKDVLTCLLQAEAAVNPAS